MNPNLNNPALNTIDLSKRAEHLWTSKAKKLMDEPKSKHTVVQIAGTMKTFQAVHLACAVPKAEVDDAIKLVVGQINHLVSKGLVHGFLSDVIALEYLQSVTDEDKVIVMCYPMVSGETYKKLVKKTEIQDEVTLEMLS